ncbi:uncharacterized protein LOC127904385 [Populus trichocarpa]|uniref:uncharacterized protein LOC127904385 n=1 Tax=Populus trichocarpa TaxID=3694 RepID=UPI00227897D0|nr:uncharacterized protein LOC127904385 [Populus trichocarpa]
MTPPREDASDLKYVVGDKVLVIRRSLSVQTKEDDLEQQKENIFHTRCLINDKVCSMIIDSGRHWQFDRKAKHDGFKNKYSLEKDGRIYTLAPLTPKQVYEDPIQLKKSYEEEHSALAKVEEQAEQHGENVRKSENKEAYFNSDNLDSCVPNAVKVLLHELEDVFPEEILSGLPPIRRIEHQIDFVLGASIPNRPAYRSNPEESKELQQQVEELMSKGYIHESMSPD